MTDSVVYGTAPEAGDEIASLRERLRDAERRLEQAERLGRIGYWETDLRTGLGWWSDELCLIYGVRPGRRDIGFEEFLAHVHPDDIESIRRLNETARSSRAPCEARYRILRPDHTERLVQCRAEMIFDEAGVPQKISGATLDITDFVRLENALRDSETRYRTLVEQAPVGIFLIGADRRFLMVNPAWERMTGYAASELARLTTLDITHPEDAESSTRFFEQVMRGELERPLFEKRYLRRNGEVLWGRVHATVIRDPEGQPRFRLVIIEDITAEKEAVQRRAETARQQREALVREVHHRIKNTLQGVAGLLERHAAGNPALGPAIDEARTQLNALAVVHGLQSSAASAEVNLCNIVRGIVDMLKLVSPAQLKFDLPEGFVPIEVADEESVPVALILNELVTNALKHLHAGTEQAVVSVTLNNSGGAVVVVVRNEPARLPASFDFDSDLGLGTGLKLAKSLLPAQGASLRVLEPSPGRVEAVLKLWPPVLRVPPVPKHGGGPM